MKRQENKLDALLKQKLEGLEAETTSQDWLAIRDRLDRDVKPGGFFKRNLKYLALLLFTIIGIGIGILISTESRLNNKQVLQRENTGKVNNEQSQKPLNVATDSKLNTIENKSTNREVYRENMQPNAVSGRGGDVVLSATTAGLSKARDRRFSNHSPDKHSSFEENPSSAPYGLSDNKAIGSAGFDKLSRHDADTGFDKLSRQSVIAGTGFDKLSQHDSNTDFDKLSRHDVIASAAKQSAPQRTPLNAKENTFDSSKELAKATPQNDSLNPKKSPIEALKKDSTPPASPTSKTAITALHKKSISFFISYSAQATNHTLVSNSALADYKHKDYDSLRAKQEKGGYSYNFSCGLEYRLKKFIFQSGIGYKRFTETVAYNFINNNIPVLDSATGKILGYITLPGGAPTTYSHVNTYNYITVPIIIGYNFSLSQKLSLMVKAGGELMFFSSTTGQIIRQDDLSLQSATDMKILRSSTFSLFGNIALEYRLNKFIYISLGPDFRQMQKSIYTDKAPSGWLPRSAGLNFTTRISLL